MFYLSLFFVFSIFGFIFEQTLSLVSHAKVASGFLYGPWKPIYGFAILLILGINKFLKSKYIRKEYEVMLFFIVITIVMTLFEFLSGNIIYLITKEALWDYSSSKYHFTKFICLEVSLIWGIMATIINYYVYPKIKKYIEKIPDKLIIAFIVAFIIDIIISIVNRI